MGSAGSWTGRWVWTPAVPILRSERAGPSPGRQGATPPFPFAYLATRLGNQQPKVSTGRLGLEESGFPRERSSPLPAASGVAEPAPANGERPRVDAGTRGQDSRAAQPVGRAVSGAPRRPLLAEPGPERTRRFGPSGIGRQGRHLCGVPSCWGLGEPRRQLGASKVSQGERPEGEERR